MKTYIFKTPSLARCTAIGLALLCGTILSGLPARAASLDDANRAFSAGHYQESTSAYQAVLKDKGYSSSVLFDLGNSYLKEGKIGDAILAYKRAQWLAPNDPDVAANLQIAETKASLPMSKTNRLGELAHLMNASTWAWTGSGALTVLCASVLAMMLFPQRQSVYRFVGGLSALVMLVCVVSILSWSSELQEGIVVQEAEALISPFPTAQAAFKPTVGETVTVGNAYGDFLFVHDSVGRTGWINKSHLTRIVTASTSELENDSNRPSL
jgi:hypothetical protein